jgi:hypothetical protein
MRSHGPLPRGVGIALVACVVVVAGLGVSGGSETTSFSARILASAPSALGCVRAIMFRVVRGACRDAAHGCAVVMLARRFLGPYLAIGSLMGWRVLIERRVNKAIADAHACEGNAHSTNITLPHALGPGGSWAHRPCDGTTWVAYFRGSKGEAPDTTNVLRTHPPPLGLFQLCVNEARQVMTG